MNVPRGIALTYIKSSVETLENEDFDPATKLARLMRNLLVIEAEVRKWEVK